MTVFDILGCAALAFGIVSLVMSVLTLKIVTDELETMKKELNGAKRIFFARTRGVVMEGIYRRRSMFK